VKLEQELFATNFDEAKLQQGLTKVLENAVEAVNDGGQIHVQTRNIELAEPAQDSGVRLAAGAHVCVEISDNGAGIEPAHLPQVFEPFFTTKKPPHRGLGLALLYGVISSHEGGVAISSQPGAGTSVRIYLPAEKQTTGLNAASNENLHGIESILVVDDESMLLAVAETIFGEYGYKVLTASNGQKALAMLARDDLKVDLLVTDLVMPSMGGRELIERARELRPQIKVLCISGIMLSTEQQMGLAYLKKPFSCRDLLFKARVILGQD
jgi:CheY-like chemotaxis protein